MQCKIKHVHRWRQVAVAMEGKDEGFVQAGGLANPSAHVITPFWKRLQHSRRPAP